MKTTAEIDPQLVKQLREKTNAGFMDCKRALAEAGGIVAKAAEALGLSRQALYRKMERLGITLERRPKE